jgi:hypothetical protein
MLLLLPAIVACQAKSGQGEAADPAARVLATQQGARPVPTLADGSSDVNAIMAENDRMIAENDRMARALTQLRNADRGRFDRLKTDCQDKFGQAADADGARRISRCIGQAW